MKVHHLTPYAVDKNIGKSYNEACALIPGGDWICIRDGDTMFTSPDWGRRVQEVAENANSSGFSLIGAKTNRIGGICDHSLVTGVFDVEDMSFHAKLENEVWDNWKDSIRMTRAHDPIGGFFMLFPQFWWQATYFPENCITFDIGFTNRIRSLGGKVGIATGIYLYHFYRGWSDNPQMDTKHLL